MTASLSRVLGSVALMIPCALTAQAKPSSLAAKDLNPVEMIAVAPRVKSIKAEPATLTLHVGETVSFGKITVTVFDSSGQAVGRLLGYDFGIKPGEPANAVPRQVTGVRPGTTELVISYPRSSWNPRKDPQAQARVKIVVVK